MSTLVDSFSREDWRSIPRNISSVCLTSLRDEKSVLSQRASCSASSVYQPRTITLSQSPTCLCQPIRAQCGEGAANERLVMCREPRWAPWHYCRDCTGPVDVAQQPPSLAGTQSENPLTATPSAPPAPCQSSPPLRSPPACWVSSGLGSLSYPAGPTVSPQIWLRWWWDVLARAAWSKTIIYSSLQVVETVTASMWDNMYRDSSEQFIQTSPQHLWHRQCENVSFSKKEIILW